MKQVIYCSKAVRPFLTTELAGMLTGARTRNTDSDVTGLLLYCAGSFMQLLEGPEPAVADIYASIKRDARHQDLRLLRDEMVGHRRFPEWSMGFEAFGEEDLVEKLPGFREPGVYPLVNAQLIVDAAVAETLLTLYARSDSGE